MNDLAMEERANLGLTAFEPLDMHLLAEEYGIPIYCLADLADEQSGRRAGRGDRCRLRLLSREGTAVVAGQGSVDGRSADPEQVGELTGAVLPSVEQGDQVRFLAGLELWLLPA